MSEQSLHELSISFLIVGVALGFIWIFTRALTRRLAARRSCHTYVLYDGSVNSITVTFDVKLSDSERKRILSEYGKVLSTYALSFDPKSVFDVKPEP